MGWCLSIEISSFLPIREKKKWIYFAEAVRKSNKSNAILSVGCSAVKVMLGILLNETKVSTKGELANSA